MTSVTVATQGGGKLVEVNPSILKSVVLAEIEQWWATSVQNTAIARDTQSYNALQQAYLDLKSRF